MNPSTARLTRPKRTLRIDGMPVRRVTVPAYTRSPVTPIAATRPSPAPLPIAPRTYAKPTTAKKPRRQLPQAVEMSLIITGAMVVGILAQSSAVGQAAIVLYGAIAFFRRISSRTTFTLALLSMVATILLLVVRGNIAMAQNFATYTFLLLVVGVITLNREIKKEGGRIYNRRQKIT